MRTLCIDEIIRLIGEDEAAALVEQIGGLEYYFPADARPCRHVSISPEAWAKLCQHFSGFAYIPKSLPNIKKARDAEIREKRAGGALLVDLAVEYKLTTRHIRGICGGVRRPKARRADRDPLGYLQIDIFGGV